jgi:hypothetical protein
VVVQVQAEVQVQPQADRVEEEAEDLVLKRLTKSLFIIKHSVSVLFQVDLRSTGSWKISGLGEAALI